MRPPAAQRAPGASHCESCILQHFQRGSASFRMKVVIERIHPTEQLGVPWMAPFPNCCPLRKWNSDARRYPSPKAHCRHSWHIGLCGAKPKIVLQQVAGSLVAWLQKISESRRFSDPCLAPPLDQADWHTLLAAAASSRNNAKEIPLVSRNIDVRRAFRLARLARKTQFQCILNVFVLPTERITSPWSSSKACERVPACCVLLQASPYNSGTSRRRHSSGTLRVRCIAAWPSQMNHRHRGI